MSFVVYHGVIKFKNIIYLKAWIYGFIPCMNSMPVKLREHTRLSLKVITQMCKAIWVPIVIVLLQVTVDIFFK